jgi:glycosyltransferase involved in cell wall biosynthesis
VRCPTLAALPPPPPGKTGWPWTEECPQLPEIRLDGTPWPRISIVTPSYNQGQYIEETIRSILLQGYPDLEYFIMDGGSSDDSVAVINKYAEWLKYWESRPDQGQAHAINKGLAKATGLIWNFINSDDTLTYSALDIVGNQKIDAYNIIATSIFKHDGDEIQLIENKGITFKGMTIGVSEYETSWHGLGIWTRVEDIKKINGYDQELRFFFDWDAHVRILKIEEINVFYIDRPTVIFRIHRESKTFKNHMLFVFEELQILVREKTSFTNRKEILAINKKISSKRSSYIKLRTIYDIAQIKANCQSKFQRTFGIIRYVIIKFPLDFDWRFVFGALIRSLRGL